MPQKFPNKIQKKYRNIQKTYPINLCQHRSTKQGDLMLNKKIQRWKISIFLRANFINRCTDSFRID